MRYGPLTLPSRWFLAPLAGYTNLPFRRVCRELGGMSLATTDLVNARALVEGRPKTMGMVATCPEDRPFSVQIFGADPVVMRDAAAFLVEYGVDAIDINMGCPVDRITKGGAGSAMMTQACATVNLVRTVVEAGATGNVPVTVKMRLGWDDTQITSPKFAREFEQAGVAAVMVHGRTRAQGFSGGVDLEGIRATAEAVESIPCIGNGDVLNVEDAAHMLRVTGCDGVSVGRGALANPWIFRQLSEWEQTGEWSPPGSFNDRLTLLKKQFAYLRDHYRDIWDEEEADRRAVVGFRKMGHWYLKAMKVKASLRHTLQTAKTVAEFFTVLDNVAAAGPVVGTKDGVLPEMHVPVPSGPVERW